jgi:OmpA-OmpF porin, OOP family
MNTYPALAMVVAGTLLAGGCATKKYVRNTTAPIESKVDQVGEQATKNAASIGDVGKEIRGVNERAETGISAANERAMSAENRAKDSMTKATEAGSAAAEANAAAGRNLAEIAALRNVVANIDDYKVKSEATVNFKFGKHELTDEGKASLDKMVADAGSMKRFVISVEGFTDQVGSADYNTALSKKRAEAVTNYLVSKHNVPVYRIYNIGLGKDRPLDEGKTREARAKNRRVEVRVFSAEIATAQMASTSPSN